MEINILSLIVISVISFLLIYFFYNLRVDNIYRIAVIGLGFSTFIYSGAGISIITVKDKYIFHFLIYLFCLLFSFYFFYGDNNVKDRTVINIQYGNRRLNNTVVYSMVIIYFLMRISYLVIPSFRLHNLFIPPKINVFGVQYLNKAFSANQILSLTGLISTLTLPFFFILINSLMREGKKKKAVILILFWGYLDYAIFEYMSRSAFITSAFFLYLVLHLKKENLVFKKTEGLVALLGFFSLVPLLSIYESYRLKIPFNFVGLGKIYESLFISETGYTRYYDIIINSDATYGIGNYLFWIATLPIPKSIFPIQIATFNSYFTNLIDENLDYFVLPSILGEAFMIFGDVLFWLHGLIIGTILGVTFKILSKYEFSRIILLYIVVLTFNLGRGGSMQIISFSINSIFVIWIGLIASKIFSEKHIKSVKGGI